MYIWTREGLGQGQPIWSTLQTFNRPRGQPTPNGYLGNFNEHMGKTESEPCKQIWAVPGFKPRSSELLDFQKRHINDIATRIVSLLQGDLKGKGRTSVCAFVLFMKGMWIRKLTRRSMGSLMRNGQLRSPRSLGSRY